MPFTPCPGCASATITYIVDQQRCQNVLHFTFNDGAIDLPALTTLRDGLSSWLVDTWMPVVSNLTSLWGVTVKSLEVENGFQLTQNFGSVVGGQAGLMDPNNVTIALRFNTVLGGRSGRGRAYLVGIPQGEVVANHIDTDWLVSVLDAWSPALNDAIGPNWLHGVLSLQNLGVPRTEGICAAVIDYGFSDNVVDSQRRRLPGRGR